MNSQYYQKMQELMKYMIFSTSDNKYATKYDNLESIDLTTGALANLNTVKDQWWDLLIEYLNNEPDNLTHPFFRKGDFPQYKGIIENVPSTIEFITNMIDLPASFMNSYINDIKKQLIYDNDIVDRKRMQKIANLVGEAVLTRSMNNDIVALLSLIEINDLKVTGSYAIKRGDINEDGVIDVTDYLLMQQIEAGYKIQYNPEVADINGDGKIDVDDLVLLEKMIAGWKVQAAPDVVINSCRNLTTSSANYLSTFEKEVKKSSPTFNDYRFTYLSDFANRIINKDYSYTIAAKDSLKGGLGEILFKTYQDNHFDYLNQNFRLLYELLNIDINEIINIDITQEIVQQNQAIVTNFVDILVNSLFLYNEVDKSYHPVVIDPVNNENIYIQMTANVESYFVAKKLDSERGEGDEDPQYYREKCKDVTSLLNVADQYFTEFEKAWKNYVANRHSEINSVTITSETQYSGLKNFLVKVNTMSAYNVGFSKTDLNNLKRALSQVYFQYYLANDEFSWTHSAFNEFYVITGLLPSDITNATASDQLSSWNESVNTLVRNILNGFDYSLLKYNDRATVEVKPNVFFKLSDILNGNAALSFDANAEWVRSWKNSDDQTYKEVRDNDIMMPAITKRSNLDFTKDPELDEIGITLLLPEYQRNVEIEDLDRNFWVIGQTLTGLMAFLFGDNSPFKTVFQGIIKEIIELWENVLYLWLGFAMTLSDKVSYDKIHEEIVYLPMHSFQNEVKYDNFDLNNYSTESTVEEEIWAQSGDTIIDKIKNYLNTEHGEERIVEWIKPKIDYLISKYTDSHLGILPVIRLNNYENNYYEAEFYPGFFAYDRNQDTPSWEFWSFKTPEGEQFTSANINYSYTNLGSNMAAHQVNKTIGLVGKSYLNRKSLYYFKPAGDMIEANDISLDYLTEAEGVSYDDFFVTSNSTQYCLFYGAKKTSVTYYIAVRPIFNKVKTNVAVGQTTQEVIEPFSVYDSDLDKLRFNKIALNLCDMSKIACNSDIVNATMVDDSTFAKLTWTYEDSFIEGETNSDQVKGEIVANNNYKPDLITLDTETVDADDSTERSGCWWLKPASGSVDGNITRITPVEVYNQKNGFYMGEILTSFVGFFNIE